VPNWYVYFAGKMAIIFPARLIESEIITHIKLWCPKKGKYKTNSHTTPNPASRQGVRQMQIFCLLKALP
jgi:hypothetical protein